jgi:protein-S-isoprenylcysteine O-methyltransferase Ste14
MDGPPDGCRGRLLVTETLAKAVLLLGAVGWFVIRYPHQRRARKTPVRKSARGVREILLLSISAAGLGIVPFLYILTGVPRFADRPFIPALAWCGALLFAAALWLFYATHRELGRNWSVSLELRDQHALITRGVYARVRHPMYSAFWLWAIAQALLLPNWVAGSAGILGFGTLFLCRVGREEELMLEAFGERYRDYMRRTARIVPWIY